MDRETFGVVFRILLAVEAFMILLFISAGVLALVDRYKSRRGNRG
jgi:hypothetical protein